MTYLLSQYWIFIALSFLLGLFVGWATCGAADARDSRSGWFAWAMVAFIGGLFLALFKVVPGVAGHLLEVALLLFGGYVAGCVTGCGGHWAVGEGDTHSPPTHVSADAHASAPPPAAISAAFTHQDVLGVDSLASYPGARPDALWIARGKADDLTSIAGVNATTAKALNEIGVFHHHQIAKWRAPEIAWVEHHLAFPDRIEREGWIAQAGEFARRALA